MHQLLFCIGYVLCVHVRFVLQDSRLHFHTFILAVCLFTGELIGFEYLYDQTGKVFEPPALDVDTPEPEDEVDDDGDEGFVDVTDATIGAPSNDPQLSVAELPAPQRQRTVPSTPERSRPSSASSARTTMYSPPRPSCRSVSRLNTSWVLLFFTFAGVLASVMWVVDT